MKAMQEIKAERQRQIEVEGWTPEHDDTHADGEMLRAAVIYYQHGARKDMPLVMGDGAPIGWPWEARWWKPKDPHRDLVRAGALCLAERERLQRARRRPIGWWPTHVKHKFDLIVRALGATST